MCPSRKGSLQTESKLFAYSMHISKGGGGQDSSPTGKSQVAICFLRKAGMNPRVAVGPVGSNRFSERVCMTLM